jgi:hypothetical protein
MLLPQKYSKIITRYLTGLPSFPTFFLLQSTIFGSIYQVSSKKLLFLSTISKFTFILSLEFTTTLVMLYTHRLLRYSIPGYRETHPEDVTVNSGISVISNPDRFQPEFQVQETKNPVKPTKISHKKSKFYW